MNRSKPALILVVLGFVLTGCHPKTTGDIISQSPDKNITITIAAVKPMLGDPWKVTLKVKAYTLKESKIMFEVYGGLNEQNVKFDWADNNHCTITIPDRNEKPRMFRVEADSSQGSVSEI